MLKTFNISLDLEDKTTNSPFLINQNDLNTIEVDFVLTKNKKTVDLTGVTPRLVIKKPSNYTVIQDCEITDVLNGKFKVTLNTQAYIETGFHVAEVYLYEGTQKVAVTNTFSYVSNKAILSDKTVNSTNEWQSINDALIQIDDSMAQLEDGLATLPNKVDKVPGKDLSTNDYNNTEKAEVAKVKDKADTSYVDGKIGTLSSLNTTNKTNLVNAINENAVSLADNAQKVNFFTTPEKYGAKGDGVTDDSSAFNQAASSFNGKNGVIILDPTKTYALKNTVYVPFNVSIQGNLANIIPISGGTFVNNFMFYVNVTSGGTTIQPWGGDILASISGLKFSNPSNLTVKGIYSRSKTNFKNITFEAFYKGILREGAGDFDYSDQIEFKGIIFNNCLGSEPLLEIKYNGDGLLIDGCHTAGGGSNNYNFLSLTFCNGGKITRCLNGNITINKSTAISLENWHCEHGKLVINSSQVSMRNIYQWYHQTYQPIPLTITDSGSADKPTSPCSIENYAIIHIQNRTSQDKNYTTPNYFDAYFKNANVNIVNFFRRSIMNIDQSIGMETGVKISFDGTTISNEWDIGNQLYSKNSYIAGNKVFTNINEALFPANFVNFSVSQSAFATFDEAPNTYFYAVMYYFGYFDRLVGRFGLPSVSTTLADQSKVPFLQLQYDTVSQLSKVRIYRGNSSGQYDKYVDVPIGNGLNLIDYGYFISTGEKWVNRTVGAIDTFNSSYVKARLEQECMIVHGTAIPTVGTWKVGDRVINTNRVVGQPRAWVCTTAGTPGTWLSEGNY